MAENTLDSAAPPGTSPPPIGPGSKTPPDPLAGSPPPLGGGPKVPPAGMPGAPPKGKVKSPEEIQQDQLNQRATKSLIEDIADEVANFVSESGSIAGGAPVSSSKVVQLVNDLLDSGWTERQLKRLIRKTGLTPKKFFEQIAKKIQKGDAEDAIKFIEEKVADKEEEEEKKEMEKMEEAMPKGTPPSPPPTPPLGGGTPPPPPLGAPPAKKLSTTDVGLEQKLKTGEGTMGTKVVVKEGTLVEVSDNVNEILDKIVVEMRKTKASVKAYEEAKIKYAGKRTLKKAMEDDLDMSEDEDLDEDLDEDEDVDLEDVKDAVAKIKDAVKDLESAVGVGEKTLEDTESPMEAEEGLKLDEAVEKAGPILANAKATIKQAKKDIKKLAKGGSQEAMDATIGKKNPKEDKKKKDEKKKASDGEAEEKEASDNDNLIKRVKARLSELRKEKEAQLYPFKNIAGPAEKVDNINETTANQQISTADSEIKKQPVKDKDDPTINPEIAQKDLPAKDETKGGTKENKVKPAEAKKVSMDIAEKMRIDSLRNAVDKARLSVELASQQQLKGLLDNPLREAMIKNMVEAGIPEDSATDIVHNAFIDGYEDAQKIIIKEAFSTFMKKEFDDFVKVARFTQNHIIKESDVLSPVDGEDNREKTASESTPPLRGSKVATKKEEFSKYWRQVGHERRGF